MTAKRATGIYLVQFIEGGEIVQDNIEAYKENQDGHLCPLYRIM